MNSKGQLGLENIFIIMAFIFAAGIGIVILAYAWSQISPNLETAINQAVPSGETSFNISTLNSAVKGGTITLNVMFPFLILGLLIFGMVGAFLTNNNAMFFFIFIIIIVVTILLGVIFSNIYQQLTTDTPLENQGESFLAIKLFLKNFPFIILVISSIILFILFAKSRGGGGL